MKLWRFSVVAVALIIGGGSASTQGNPIPAGPRQFQIDVSLLQGDPLGSREAGTIVALSRPTLRALEKQEACVHVAQLVDVVGESVGVGYRLRLVVEPAAEGKVRMRVFVELTTVADKRDDQGRVRVDRNIYVREARLGETLRLRVANRSKKETWVELRVQEVK
jgi:hypothetical protein